MLRKIAIAVLTAATLCAPARADQTTLTTPSSPLTMTGLASFLNSAFTTIATNYSGSTPPAVCIGSTACTYQFWLDTSTSPHVLRTYDGTSWVAIGSLDTTGHSFSFAIAETPVTRSGGTDTIADSDRGKLVRYTNASATASTLPQAGAGSAFASGWFIDIRSAGTGTTTITPTTSTIDGAAALVLPPGMSVRIMSDGSNYFTTQTPGTPTTTILGGVYSKAAVTSNWLRSLGTDGIFTASQPAASDLSNGTTGSGSVVLSVGPTITGTLGTANQTITSASASALAVGLNGAMHPAFLIDASTASSATGIGIKSAAAGGGVALAAISSGSNEAVTIDARGSGTITLGATSTGAITLTRATTMSAALTYGGVTLSNSVTGTGPMVLAASPTITGHATIEGVTATGSTGTGKLVFDGSPTLVTPLLGVATATSINKMAITAPATSSTLAVADGKTATISNTLTFTGTDSSSIALGAGGAVAYKIASGAKALATSAIGSAACTSAQTDTATGTLTTDAVIASFNGDPTAVTGYVPLTTGMLTIIVYPTADTVNFKVCNNTNSSITPGAITINWRVVR